MRELKSIEEKILDRTLYLIGKTGSLQVPIRTIAKEAEVNVASINYYFHTKEALINKTKEFYIENVTFTLEPLEDDTKSDLEKLNAFSERVMDYCIRFPGITILAKEARRAETPDALFLEILRLTDLLHQLLGETLAKAFHLSPAEMDVSRTVLLASIVHPLDRLAENPKEDHFLLQVDQRKHYIEAVLNMIADLPKHMGALKTSL